MNVDQQTPWQGLLELSYVGNRSQDLQNTSGRRRAATSTWFPTAPCCPPPIRRLRMQTSIGRCKGMAISVEATNNLYSNYNALQVSWVRHAGMYVIQTNYTFQKALGIVSPTIDPFNLNANYGPLASDRRHLFNVAYSLDLGTRIHSNAFANGAVNGWQLSGVVQRKAAPT